MNISAPLQLAADAPLDTGQALIEAHSLRKRFGSVLAVDDISLTVARGEVLGFLGPNGAGKSTTMKMLTGYLPPSAGSAAICGVEISADPLRAKQHMGYLPEGSPLYGDMTTKGLLGFVASVRGLGRRERKQRIDFVVERLGLHEVFARRIETLSKGFRRRVGMAQAIVHDPDVLILDEPTDGLDPNQKHDVRNLIVEMGRDKAIIISTHILEEVDAVCDRAVIISRGRVVGGGTPAALHAQAREHNAVRLRVPAFERETAAALLRAVPGVASVEVAGSGSVASVLALPLHGQFIADRVGIALRQSNLNVVEIRSEVGHLDDVFRELTSGPSGTEG